LFVAVLFAYELFDLWSQPYWTAMLIVGYFGAATMVDVLFRRASFCKYVCPIGQFNFLGSTLSPLEVSVRDRDVCTTCTTKDCIRGRRAPAESVAAGHDVSQHSLPIIQRGCELALFQPRKVGNLDCTFCLDCVYACPHDNVGIRTRLGAQDLPSGAPRSGIGSLDRRLDFSVLAAVFTFGALLNALAMTSPIYALEQWISATTHCTVEWPILGSIFFVGLVLEPLVMLSVAAAFSRRSAGVNEPLVRTVNRFARSLIPLGFGIWLAHYGFHFFTGFLTVIPVTQDALVQLGWPILGEPLWHLVGMPKEAVYPIEIGMMVLGLVGSWIVAWRIAAEYDP
jgi:ferredoxin